MHFSNENDGAPKDNESARISINIPNPLTVCPNQAAQSLLSSFPGSRHFCSVEPDRSDRRPCAATRALTKAIRPHPSCTHPTFCQQRLSSHEPVQSLRVCSCMSPDTVSLCATVTKLMPRQWIEDLYVQRRTTLSKIARRRRRAGGRWGW